MKGAQRYPTTIPVVAKFEHSIMRTPLRGQEEPNTKSAVTRTKIKTDLHRHYSSTERGGEGETQARTFSPRENPPALTKTQLEGARGRPKPFVCSCNPNCRCAHKAKCVQWPKAFVLDSAPPVARCAGIVSSLHNAAETYVHNTQLRCGINARAGALGYCGRGKKNILDR